MNNTYNVGMHFYDASNNTFINITTSYDEDYCFAIYYSENNTLIDLTATNCPEGFSMWGGFHDNIITNLNVSYNVLGIRTFYENYRNVFRDSYIIGNTQAGLFLDGSGSDDPEYNVFYNNIFNTLNVISGRSDSSVID